MLYVSIKNKNQTYTAHQALTRDALLNDLLIPIRLPFFDDSERSRIFDMGFEKAVTHILSKFFVLGDKLNQIESCIHDYCPTINTLDRKTQIVTYRSMHNLEENIGILLTERPGLLPLWPRCAIRISMLFGLFPQLNTNAVDFAICTNDPVNFLPLLIGKAMGLPTGKIICGTESEDPLWVYMRNDLFRDDSEFFSNFIVSENRANDLVKGVLGSYKQQISKSAAFSYGALQDYRAITGDNQPTILLNEL